MSWIFVTILSYFILAVVFLVDKYLLTSSILNPKVYVFYVGLLGGAVILLIPFVGLSIPVLPQLLLALSTGIVFVCGLFWLYKSLSLFDASRVIPAVGGLTPIFTFIFISVVSGEISLSFVEVMAFLLLISGSVIINLRRNQMITLNSFKFSVLAAFFLSLSLTMAKYVYMQQAFWDGFIWRTLGGVVAALMIYFLFSEVRQNSFKGQKRMSGKTSMIFILNQSGGAFASILQNWAIFLAPLVYVPMIQALNGTQYVFLFLFAILLSLKFPKIIKEELSSGIVLQKIIAIALIGAGLFFLYAN